MLRQQSLKLQLRHRAAVLAVPGAVRDDGAAEASAVREGQRRQQVERGTMPDGLALEERRVEVRAALVDEDVPLRVAVVRRGGGEATLPRRSVR